MSEDGRIDYSRYSREDLLQVLDHIDGESFPINLTRVREELARRPVVPDSPPPLPPPPRTKSELTAVAMKLDLSGAVIVGYTVLLLVLTFVFELVALWATFPEEVRGPWSLLPVLCLGVLLAKCVPSGFYVNASVVVLGNTAFWTLLSLGGSRALDGPSILSGLFWSLCTVSVAGLLCGLWHVGDHRPEDA